MVCTSNESAALEQRTGASPVSTALTVPEIRLTKVNVSGASAMNLFLPEESISQSGYISRMISTTKPGDGWTYMYFSRPTDSFDVHIVHIPHHSFMLNFKFFYPNIYDFGHQLCEIKAL